MRAKTVNENISFERGQDPKVAMDIGATPEAMLERLKKDYRILSELVDVTRGDDPNDPKTSTDRTHWPYTIDMGANQYALYFDITGKPNTSWGSTKPSDLKKGWNLKEKEKYSNVTPKHYPWLVQGGSFKDVMDLLGEYELERMKDSIKHYNRWLKKAKTKKKKLENYFAG